MSEETEIDINILKTKLDTLQKNVNMIVDRLTPIVKQEVEIQLHEKHLTEFISKRVETEIKDNFEQYLEKVISSMSKTIIKKFKNEMDVAKKLSYSIDKSVQHALMKSSCSVEEHQIFMKRMNEIFKTMESKMLLESKQELLKIGVVNE